MVFDVPPVGPQRVHERTYSSSALYLKLEAARTVFDDPRATCAWGPPNDCRGITVPGGYRVTGRWDFASGCRHATCQMLLGSPPEVFF